MRLLLTESMRLIFHLLSLFSVVNRVCSGALLTLCVFDDVVDCKLFYIFQSVSLFSRVLHRRASAGGLEGLNPALHGAEHEQHPPHPLQGQLPPPFNQRRPHSSMSGKMGARSWHPSPFGSDDEEGEHHFFKEEKKNRIKMEIARRRHQIEENARLHEELIRLAKLRENAESGVEGGGGHHRLGVQEYPGPAHSPGREGNSVLRSVDEILRAEHGGSHGHGRHHGGPRVRRLHDEVESFNPDRYTASVYDRVTDFSPVNSDFSNELMFGHGGHGAETMRHMSRAHAPRANMFR